jgi:SAM-dependent methyltransferase
MGHLFVNFDLVYEILEWLSSRSNARSSVAGDVKNLPFKASSFDCLTCIDLIHHESEQLEQLLASFSHLLRPGGLLFLEDVNAWGMFQFPKSILMPKALHRSLRSFYRDELVQSGHRPADYEFPTNPFTVKKIMERIGFVGIVFFPNRSYPTRHERLFRFYTFFSGNERIAKYHNYHYMLMAKKGS